MSHFLDRDLSFFNFLLDATEKQLDSTLTYLSPGQYALIKRIAEGVVEELVPITAREFADLAPDGAFVERLADGPRIRASTLVKKRGALIRLANIAVKHHETHAESGARPQGRLGQNEGQGKSQNGERNRSATLHGDRKARKSRDPDQQEKEDQHFSSSSSSGSESCSSSEEEEEEDEEEGVSRY